jgi:uncharacterized membrane protein YeiH
VEPVNRRTFLKQAGVTAAAVGAIAAAPGSIGIAGATTAGAATAGGGALREAQLSHEEAGAARSLIAHVRNAATGEIALYVGEREITIHDRQVAARLVRASR